MYCDSTVLQPPRGHRWPCLHSPQLQQRFLTGPPRHPQPHALCLGQGPLQCFQAPPRQYIPSGFSHHRSICNRWPTTSSFSGWSLRNHMGFLQLTSGSTDRGRPLLPLPARSRQRRHIHRRGLQAQTEMLPHPYRLLEFSPRLMQPPRLCDRQPMLHMEKLDRLKLLPPAFDLPELLPPVRPLARGPAGNPRHNARGRSWLTRVGSLGEARGANGA
mmetsp:Transcript_53216/g.139570  ORF Transcript_53216/g.139570 Transcript_53216/m.139570 type:complete len:216 (+) Transcript_53216:366-1013(+)